MFLRNPRRVLSRTQIFETVWGYDFGPDSNALWVSISCLRSKLEADGAAAGDPDRARPGVRAAGGAVNLRTRVAIGGAVTVVAAIALVGAIEYPAIGAGLRANLDAESDRHHRDSPGTYTKLAAAQAARRT